MAYPYTPDYVQPVRYSDPNNPQASTSGQLSDFWKNQSYSNPYAKFTKKAGQRSDQMFSAARAMNPGTLFNDPASFRARFGFKSLNPNDPQLGQWMANLQGGVNNQADASARQFANAGVAAGRGGFGVAGGVSADAAARQEAVQKAAEMYGQNFDRSVGYMRDSANLENSTAGAMASLYGNVYNTNVNAGENLLGQEFQGTKAGADDFNSRLNQIFQAYSTDTANANRLKEGAQKTFQEKQSYEAAAREKQRGIDKNIALQNQLRTATLGATHDTASPWAVYNAVQEYLRQQGVIKTNGKGGSKGITGFDPSTLTELQKYADWK